MVCLRKARRILLKGLLADFFDALVYIHTFISSIMKGVLGIIRRENRFLLGIEAKNLPWKGSWRLLGGTVEAKESDEAALVRELSEEAGISIRVVNHLGKTKGTLNPIDINVYLAEHIQGTLVPKKNEITELKYFSVDELDGIKIEGLSKSILNDFKRNFFKK